MRYLSLLFTSVMKVTMRTEKVFYFCLVYQQTENLLHVFMYRKKQNTMYYTVFQLIMLSLALLYICKKGL